MGSPNHGHGGGFGMSPHMPMSPHMSNSGMDFSHGNNNGMDFFHGNQYGMGFSHGSNQDIADATPAHLSIPPSEHEARPGIEYSHGQDIAVSTPPQGTMLASFSPHGALFSDMPSHGKMVQ